jgi:ribosomal protein S12 methylthiotransferase
MKWRAICPELVIRSTFIAGFPGETESEFAHLLDFLKEAQIDNAGCFAYSAIEGAEANNLPGMLPLELREDRKSKFMAVAQAVSAQKNKRLVGSTMQVLVDSAQSMGRAGGVGRSYRDAPEIDGIVRLIPPQRISKTFRTGEFIKAKILESNGHELVGIPV